MFQVFPLQKGRLTNNIFVSVVFRFRKKYFQLLNNLWSLFLHPFERMLGRDEIIFFVLIFSTE